MQTFLAVEMVNTFKFSVTHEVKTLADMQRLLSKAQTKIRDAVKAVPELRDLKVAKAKITHEQPKPAAEAAKA